MSSRNLLSLLWLCALSGEQAKMIRARLTRINKLGRGEAEHSSTSPESNKSGRGQAELHEPRPLSPKARPRLSCPTRTLSCKFGFTNMNAGKGVDMLRTAGARFRAKCPGSCSSACPLPNLLIPREVLEFRDVNLPPHPRSRDAGVFD